jgi:DNA adenine methylase
MKPLIKSAGGKSWLAPKIKQIYLERFDGYRVVEPFAGGAAVTFEILPKHALLNDVNQAIINLYTWVSTGIPFNPEYFVCEKDHFYRMRQEFNKGFIKGDPWSHRSAQLFYFLNKTCFNGLTRFNAKGEFNVPFGKYKSVNYRLDELPYYAGVMGRWSFTQMHFADLLLANGREDDFTYCDPPYDDGFVQYSKDGFSWEEQVELVERLKVLPGPVIASNKATDRILDLYANAGFEIELLDAPRAISCKGDRTPVREMFATRNL